MGNKLLFIENTGDNNYTLDTLEMLYEKANMMTVIFSARIIGWEFEKEGQANE